MILTNKKEQTRFFRFAIVGIIGAIVDFAIFNFLLAATPMKAIWASAISFACAVISNFILNRYWTYPDARDKSFFVQFFRFLVVSTVGLGIRIALFAILETPLISLFNGFDLPLSMTADFLGHNLTLAIAILIVMLWNFFANRFWTYNEVT